MRHNDQNSTGVWIIPRGACFPSHHTVLTRMTPTAMPRDRDSPHRKASLKACVKEEPRKTTKMLVREWTCVFHCYARKSAGITPLVLKAGTPFLPGETSNAQIHIAGENLSSLFQLQESGPALSGENSKGFENSHGTSLSTKPPGGYKEPVPS